MGNKSSGKISIPKSNVKLSGVKNIPKKVKVDRQLARPYRPVSPPPKKRNA